jgi:transposase
MERIPNRRYTQEFRAEGVKMATEGGLPVLEISKRLSLPKSTLANWIRISKAGHLGKIGCQSKHVMKQTALYPLPA